MGREVAFDYSKAEKELGGGTGQIKLRYVYDEARIKEKLLEVAKSIAKNREVLFIESGKEGQRCC